MKFKTLAIMAAAAILSTPLAYAAPTTLAADDMGTMNNSSGTDNIGSPNNDMSNGNATGPQASNDMMPGAQAGMGSNSANQSPADSSNSNDDMSADTATGDDDY